MKTSVFLYPWDVVGDPDAARRIADLGVQQVTLASAYHSTRALTPRHPRHRIVTAEHASVLYPVDEARWAGHELRPYAAGAWAPGDAYGEAAAALADAGLEVHSWVVLAHNSRLGAERPDTSVVNAYGDRYPWAPCIARPAVAAYLVALAAEAAVRPGAGGTELESCGWYGLAHLHAHDKIGGVGLDEAAQYLMSLCFCDVCGAGYAESGVSPEALAAAVRGRFGPCGPVLLWAPPRPVWRASKSSSARSWRPSPSRGVAEWPVRSRSRRSRRCGRPLGPRGARTSRCCCTRIPSRTTRARTPGWTRRTSWAWRTGWSCRARAVRRPACSRRSRPTPWGRPYWRRTSLS